MGDLRPLHGFHLCLSGRRARGWPRETIRRIESVVLDDFKPDLTLVLDLPVDTGLSRAAGAGSEESRFEKFDVDFHEKLRQAFLDIARRASGPLCRDRRNGHGGRDRRGNFAKGLLSFRNSIAGIPGEQCR